MKAKRLWENVIHGWFLLMGLVTVGCVLLITVYLVISGIPAIREIGLIKFLFGPVWDSNGTPPQFGILSFILTSIYGTAGAMLLGVPVCAVIYTLVQEFIRSKPGKIAESEEK